MFEAFMDLEFQGLKLNETLEPSEGWEVESSGFKVCLGFR